MTMRAERRLSAIMAADIVGYSRMIEADETATLAAIEALRAQVIDLLLTEYKGRVVKMMGDGAIVEFGSVVDAVLCAVAIQKQVAINQREVAPQRQIIFRIGINLGDVVVAGDDLLGDGVNVAARLEQLSPPGGVLVSGTAYDQLRGKLNLPIDFAGEQRVKNISQPVRTYSVRMEGAKRDWSLRTRQLRRYLPLTLALIALAIAAGAVAWWLQPMEPALAANPSIAVLPFDNIGGDETTGRFADGITEDIITDLARYREVDVIARNSTAVYEGKPVDVRQVGQDLNVRYVLEGSVQRQGDQIRITAQLLDAMTAAHIWSDRWDRPVADLFAVQTEISEQVTSRLVDTKGAIPASERVAARRASPKDLTAYELYVRGREALERFTKESVAEAVSLLKLAVEKDPTLARAWQKLAAAYDVSVAFGAEPATARADALRAAERAVALDPMDAIAHAHLAHLVGTLGEFQRSQAEFETALRLNPGSADVMTMYIGSASTFGEPQRGAELVDRAIRLNPDYPSWATGSFSYAYFMAGRYGDALRVLEQQSTDNYARYSWVAGAVSNAALGNHDEAKTWVTKTLEHHPDLTIEGFVSDPGKGMSDVERELLIDTMRQAGFPPCAKPDQLKGIANPIRLPECSATVAP
jgi:TolB-like protein/class 3 adenylate cyclase